MRLIKRISDDAILHVGENLTLTVEAATGDGWRNRHATTANAVLVDNVTLPADFTPGAYAYTDQFVLVNAPKVAAATAEKVADKKSRLKAEVDKKYETRMTAGIVYNGMPVRTDDRSVLNVIGANRNANANRKNVVGGQPIIVTGQMAAALETAITNYTDALGEKRYDLYTAINAAQDLTALGQLDPLSGWPNNIV